ncbi:MAG: hypothetical protein FJZ87_12040 [Chloroflexi bacterium]|nr:hypothetical protein [Chloroflexota bacterium]
MILNTITRGKAVLHNILALLFLSACAPEPTPPPVDAVGTIAAQMAYTMLTQTAAAYSPTPPLPTATPAYTSTPTIEPTPEVTKRPEVVGFAPCYQGPGATYPLVSNISETKKVELIGIGSVPGWYVIKNPYFNSPCWISAENLKIFSDHDLSGFPTITP